jgi:hypothetical protein
MACDHDANFEIAQGIDLFTDAIIGVAGKQFHTEFHHLSQAQCKAASMSSYIMGKLRGYAISTDSQIIQHLRKVRRKAARK